MIAYFPGMEICEVSPSVAGGSQLSSHPGLPLQQNHLGIGILRRGQCRRHARRAAADDANCHVLPPVLKPNRLYHYTPKQADTQEKLLSMEKKLWYNNESNKGTGFFTWIEAT